LTGFFGWKGIPFPCPCEYGLPMPPRWGSGAQCVRGYKDITPTALGIPAIHLPFFVGAGARSWQANGNENPRQALEQKETKGTKKKPPGLLR
jgi:hypothetical protein